MLEIKITEKYINNGAFSYFNKYFQQKILKNGAR